MSAFVAGVGNETGYAVDLALSIFVTLASDCADGIARIFCTDSHVVQYASAVVGARFLVKQYSSNTSNRR